MKIGLFGHTVSSVLIFRIPGQFCCQKSLFLTRNVSLSFIAIQFTFLSHVSVLSYLVVQIRIHQILWIRIRIQSMRIHITGHSYKFI